MTSVFRFKQFSVRNELSPMKVNTDGVLLGAAVSVSGREKHVLDIGTGTGTIALILAQRLPQASVVGIDIDEPSAKEAAENFAASPWSDRLISLHCGLGEYGPGEKMDLVVSNPPYYDKSLLNPDGRLSMARHSLTLSYREVLAFAVENLSDGGKVAMVLPCDCEAALMREGRSRGLFATRILRIRTVPRKEPSRIIAEFSRTRGPMEEEFLSIHDAGGNFSTEYKTLTQEYYL